MNQLCGRSGKQKLTLARVLGCSARVHTQSFFFFGESKDNRDDALEGETQQKTEIMMIMMKKNKEEGEEDEEEEKGQIACAL